MKRLLTLALSVVCSLQLPLGVATAALMLTGTEAYAVSGPYAKEIETLGKAIPILDAVTDEGSAKSAATKLKQMFNGMPVLSKATNSDMEALAEAQNKISERMFKLKKQPYFEASGLQEAWTLMTDHFSRRRAVNAR